MLRELNCLNAIAGLCRSIPWPAIPDWPWCQNADAVLRMSTVGKNPDVRRTFFRHSSIYMIFKHCVYVYCTYVCIPFPPRKVFIKGTVSRDFLLLVFSSISFPPAPEYPIRTVSNFFENSRRYSQVKVHHRYQRHRRQICHRCQQHRQQILPPVSLVLLIPVAKWPPVSTTPAENLPPVSMTLVAICHRYQRHRRQICRRCPVSECRTVRHPVSPAHEWTKVSMPEAFRYRDKECSGNRTEIQDARMPMLSALSSMPMPSYSECWLRCCTYYTI